MNLVLNDQVVDALRDAMRRGTSLKNVPGLLKRVIREDMWRVRVVERTGATAEFETFEQFIRAEPLEGLGADVRTLRNICRDDTEALDLLDQATVRRGRPPKEKGDNVTPSPKGNARPQALRRLRKDRPDLHRRVLAGELSAHAAMVEAGFRPRTITVPTEPSRLAAALRRRLSVREIEELQTALGG